MYVLNSFGLLYLLDVFGNYGLWVVAAPMTMGFLWGVNHFEKLEASILNQSKQPKSSVILSQSS